MIRLQIEFRTIPCGDEKVAAPQALQCRWHPIRFPINIDESHEILAVVQESTEKCSSLRVPCLR